MGYDLVMVQLIYRHALNFAMFCSDESTLLRR